MAGLTTAAELPTTPSHDKPVDEETKLAITPSRTDPPAADAEASEQGFRE